MSTHAYNRTYNVPFKFHDILKLVRSLTIEDKLRIEKEIEKDTLLYRAEKLDIKIPDNSIGMDEVVEEVKAFRDSSNE
jgi:hypothetical protein